MSIFRPIGQLPLRPSRRAIVNGNDPVMRATAVLSLLAVGAIHFLQIVQTFQATPLLGVAFLVLIGASVIVAARLCLNDSSHRTWTASAVVCAAAIGGYLFTRLFKTPLDNQDLGNWSCMLGLASLFIEVTLLAVSGYVAATARVFETATARVGGESGSSSREDSAAA
jgi:hypothetical protein